MTLVLLLCNSVIVIIDYNFVILVLDSSLVHNRDYQVEVVHGLMHTHDEHAGAHFFSLPIRCEDEGHLGSPDCRTIGLLTLGWSTVPPHIPRHAERPFAVQWGCTMKLPYICRL